MGRRLADRDAEVRIFGETYIRKAKVETINGFSAHAGQGGLIKYASSVAGEAQRIILIHGEPVAAQALQEKLKDVPNLPEIVFPERLTSFEL